MIKTVINLIDGGNFVQIPKYEAITLLQSLNVLEEVEAYYLVK